eukprot:gene11757-5095_t
MDLDKTQKKHLNQILKFCPDYQPVGHWKVIPSKRLCPNCSSLVEITGGCPNMNCPTCKSQFCMSCLQIGTHENNCEPMPRQQVE